jgi:lysophospholipase L1-like esterase
MEFEYNFSHTAQGFRGSHLFTAKRPDGISYRILFLGDSFTYGQGSEDSEIFVEIIRANIENSEIINSGTNGYGHRQELAVLDTLGEVVEPDLVIQMFFWNDVEDNVKRSVPEFALSETGNLMRKDIQVPADYDPLALRQATEISQASESNVWESKVWRKTYIYKLFKEGARGFRHRAFGGRKRSIQTAEQSDEAWAVTLELLKLTKKKADDIGAKFLLVSIPDYERVTPNGALKSQLPINIETEERLSALTEELGINYFDLLPAMRERQSATDTPLYFITDRHLTPEGNAAVAEILTPVIRSFL